MAYRRLGRGSTHRKATLRKITTQLIMNERVATTETRTKEIRKTAEKMITLGKRGDLSARRRATAFVRNKTADIHEEENVAAVESAPQKLFSNITPHYRDRNSGYTRMYKLANLRKDDVTPVVIIKLV